MDDARDATVSRRRLLRSAATATAVVVTTGLLTDGVATARADEEFRAHAGAAGLPVRSGTTRIRWAGPATGRLVALTFDDGPSLDYTPALLDVLEEEDVRATFCVVGRHLSAALPLARRAVEAGHELVNHSLTHADLSTLSHARHVLAELRPGMTLLAHDYGPARRRIGMASVRPVVRAAKQRGYRFVTASELFAAEPG